jgi:hypothetical protein
MGMILQGGWPRVPHWEQTRAKIIADDGCVQMEGMTMSAASKAEELRQRAEECRGQAGRCSTEPEKNHWNVLADQWLTELAPVSTGHSA